jgi:uncharacterized protein YqgC (DUF456 family)
MDILLIVLAGILLTVGFFGCFVPMLPGTPLSYLGIILLHLSSAVEFSMQFLVLWAVIVIAVQVLDYFIPVWGTKRFGGSKLGVWGSMVGVIIGLFLGPWGIVAGAFVGAFVGELLAGKTSRKAINAAFGAFVGFMLGTISQLIVAGFLIFYYVKALI